MTRFIITTRQDSFSDCYCFKARKEVFFLYYIIIFLINQLWEKEVLDRQTKQLGKNSHMLGLRGKRRCPGRPRAIERVCKMQLWEKYKIKNRGQTTTEKFAYGVKVRDSGLGGCPRPDHYTTFAASLSIVKLHKKKNCAICTILTGLT